MQLLVLNMMSWNEMMENNEVKVMLRLFQLKAFQWRTSRRSSVSPGQLVAR